jgi:hypothetical protein
MSKETGASLAALANVARHVLIARTIMSDLDAHSQPPVYQSTSTQDSSTPPPGFSGIKNVDSITTSQITAAGVLLKSQVDSAELYATYLQSAPGLNNL